MAWEWEMTPGMELGMGLGDSSSTTSAAVAQLEGTASPPAYLCGAPAAADAVRVDDVLDFSGHHIFPDLSTAAATDVQFFAPTNPFSADASHPLPAETNSSSDFQCLQASFDFYIPREEEAELEWLSQFVEDSFSDIPCQYTSLAAPSDDNHPRVDQCISSRAARSKRSRTSNPSAVWSSLTPPPQPSPSSSSSSSDLPSSLPTSIGAKSISSKGCSSSSSRGKKGGGGEGGGVRRCTHCASEKTPQWRTGPLGPKTLCNACGVRYKSGRLVPEYRPAASPTFVLTQHSNSHRKVMELRRQKELLCLGHENQPSPSPSSAAAATRPELLLDDYSVC
ncbi:GATA transcription factor [Musa troglodytarum]|uniref:GATA transcription factor n=1 Tax=Musa troglodytarum TaxID=320322 RepID=A0A9E7JID6_9LILI|nr:GATA transcription factor [Musa troglodytarum]